MQVNHSLYNVTLSIPLFPLSFHHFALPDNEKEKTQPKLGF